MAILPDPYGGTHRLVVVTATEVRLVDPAGTTADVVVYTYPASDAGRRAQFAAFGDALYVASERGEGPLAGQPEEVLVLAKDAGGSDPAVTALPYRGPGGHAFVPSAAAVEVTRAARAAGTSGGLTFGRYGVRYVVLFKDGSRGPANGPAVIDHTEPESYPYTTVGVGTTSMLEISGTDAEVDARVLFGAYDGPFPAFIEGVGRVVVTGAEVSGGGANTNLTLAAELDAALTIGTGVLLGDRATLSFSAPDGFDVDGLTSDERDRLYDRVLVLLSPPLGDGGGAAEAPYFEAGSFPLSGGAASVRLSTAELLGRPSFAEGALGLGLRASRVGALNGRLYLGDVAFDPPVPSGTHVGRLEDPAPGGGEPRSIIEAVIPVEGGEVRRWSGPLVFAAPAPGYEIRQGWYPDPRATRLTTYQEQTAGAEDYLRVQEVVLEPSATLGVALGDGVIGIITPVDPIPRNEEERAADNAVLDLGPRRVLQSEFGRPQALSFARYAETGATAADEVLGFAALGEALSEGQFGDFPLLALCKSAIYAVRFSGADGPSASDLAGFAPLAARGPVGPAAFVASGRGLYYLAADGLYRLGRGGASERRISEPLHVPAGSRLPAGAVRSFSITSDAALGVYDDGTRREVWVATGAGADRRCWVYSLTASSEDFPRWSVLARPRAGFVQLGAGVPDHGACASLDALGVYREEGGSGDPEAFELVTAGVAPADGLAVQLSSLALLCDVACDVLLTASEQGIETGAPDLGAASRGERVETEILRLTIGPGAQHFAPRLRAWVARFGVALAPDPSADDVGGSSTPAVGDRLTALHLGVAPPLRRRRPTALPT